MIVLFELEQPKGKKIGSQIIELLQVINGFQDIAIDQEIYIDFKNIRFVHPVFILTIAALIYSYRIKGYTIHIVNINNEQCRKYLKKIRFPIGLRPDELKTWNKIFNYYSGKRYLPILNFSTSQNEYETIIRNNLLSKLNQFLVKNCNLSGNFFSPISYLISEITDNIVEHSGIDRGWVTCQYYSDKNYLDIVILDMGKSILGSYSENQIEGIDNDISAIKAAISGVSTKDDRDRGRGIPTSKNMIINGLGGNFLIMSGKALLLDNKILPLPVRWNGTIIALRIPKENRNFNYLDFV